MEMGGSWKVPLRPVEGVVSWNINTACNYRCEYCTQRFMEDRGRWSRDTPRFLEAFRRLPGGWEVKISGGEPFVHPTLLEIVEGLAGIGHRISVVTNFSAPLQKILGFVEAARGRVGVFSASLHLGYVEDVGAYIEKAQVVQAALRAAAGLVVEGRGASFCVTSVATRGNLPRLMGIAEEFEAAGLVFKVQPEKQGGEVIEYDAGEKDQLLQLGGHNRTGRIEHRYEGRPCWAGARYFILDDRGQAYRCYPARRGRVERLGDFLSSEFELTEGPRPCLYRSCNCTVPIERKMMAREEVP